MRNPTPPSAAATKKGVLTPLEEKQSTEPPGILRDGAVSQARRYNTDIPLILPHERVFPIQIGSELFRLSGASISSDGMCICFLLFGACVHFILLREGLSEVWEMGGAGLCV